MSEEVSNLELFTTVLTQNSFCCEVTSVNSDNQRKNTLSNNYHNVAIILHEVKEMYVSNLM